MIGKHIAFFLDQAYGNTVPSLGIAMQLIERGHRVTYVVTEHFASLIRCSGATPIIIDLLEVRRPSVEAFIRENDHENYVVQPDEMRRMWKEWCDKRTDHAIPQLMAAYDGGEPDLVVFDHIVAPVAREFARRVRAKRVELSTQFIEEGHIDSYIEDEPVLITVPRFFHRKLDQFDANPKFKFAGFVSEARILPFRPWQPLNGSNLRILISPTTGLLQQVDFCRKMLDTFRHQPWDVILSLSGSHDKLSAIGTELLGDVPDNFHINRDSGNFDVLQNVHLFIGQAGQGGALEAIYWGVPQILIPPTPYHYSVARRISELGLGVCLPPAEMSPETLIKHATVLLNDPHTQRRVREARASIREDSGAELGADILERCLGGSEANYSA